MEFGILEIVMVSQVVYSIISGPQAFRPQGPVRGRQGQGGWFWDDPRTLHLLCTLFLLLLHLIHNEVTI